ncbi:MAG: hypothetical protein COA32_09760 [Fluviicola sp.]|nr:MAG: hypothetical protein COA32_09760 [Fluviicola sp.]
MNLKNLNKIKLGRLSLILIGSALIVCFAVIDNFLSPITHSFRTIAELKGLFFIIVGISTFIGILHLIYVAQKGHTNEYLLYRRMGPIISSPLTAATQGVFIYGGIEIVFIICYDISTVKEFQGINKLAVSIAMLAIVIYAFYILSAMLSDIVKYEPDNTETGKIVSDKKSK